MIAYLQDKDVTIEVPDNITDEELADINKNFHSYIGDQTNTVEKQEIPSSGIQQKQNNSPVLDFYKAHIKPAIENMGAASLPFQLEQFPEARAFAAGAANEASFGVTKAFIPKEIEKDIQAHPYAEMAGQLTGGLGSLLATSGLIKSATALPQISKEIAAKTTQLATKGIAGEIAASAPRFLPAAIMNGATFGTNTFIKRTVEALQEGNVDIVDFGNSVVKDTALGAVLGGIGGISTTPVAVTSAAGLGFLSAKADGADNAHASLNGAIWGAFELVGSYAHGPRAENLRKQALDTVSDSIAGYVKEKNPSIDPKVAKSIGDAFVVNEANKFGGVETIIKSENKNTLQVIEGINQKLLGSKVEITPEAPLKTEPSKITNERPGPKNVTPESQPPVAPENISTGIKNIETNPAKPLDGSPIETKIGIPSVYAESFPSSKDSMARNYGDAGDEIAQIHKKLGGVEYIKKMQGPELVKFSREISGDVPVVKKIAKALGYFSPTTGKINLDTELFKDENLWTAVLAHEIGHLIDFKPDGSMARGNILGRLASLRDFRESFLPENPTATNKTIRDELKKLSQYWKPFDEIADKGFTKYRHSGPELYADFISVLLNAPGKAKEIAPNGYAAFFDHLQSKPEVMSKLLELQSLIQADDIDLQKVRAGDILQMFERAEDAFRARQVNLELSKKTTWDKMRIWFFDKNALILDEREKLLKKEGFIPETDAKYAIEKNSMMAPFVKSFLDDFDQAVYKPAVSNDLLKEIKTILFLDRVGADRGELANPLGHTPKTASDLLEAMKKNDPVRFEKANQIAIAARQWFKDLSKISGAEDFFTPEQIAMIDLNDKYAPFRVIDYMKDYVAAGFAQQSGTFKDVGDPLTSLAMKGVSVVMAVERNRIKKVVGQMLLKTGIEMTPAKITNIPGHFNIQEPIDRNLGSLAWKEEGKWVAYHVDKYIADAFNNSASAELAKLSSVMNLVFGNNIFRPLWITFNTTFQGINLIRDFMRTWKNTPNLSIAKALKLYSESIPSAKKRAKGEFDLLIQEMERSGALQLNLNDLIIGQTSEDRELESILEKYGIVEGRENKFKDKPVIKQITEVLDHIRYVGDVIESIPKIVGWKALEDMPQQERAYFVRNLIGTPNPKRKGSFTPITNPVFMFSNIFKEGYREFYETAFTNPKTRDAYRWKTLWTTLIPKTTMWLIGIGAFGAGLKSMMDKASEYQKTNYMVIPLGVDSEGNGVRLTLPQDEDARFIGGLYWKLLNTLPISFVDGKLVMTGKPNQSIGDSLEGLFAFGAGQFPGVAPGWQFLKVWTDFLSGRNPSDDFRGRNILTDQQMAAGGMDAFSPMVRWTINQTGLARLDTTDRIKNDPIYKTVISSLPILQRLVRIDRQGEYELAEAARKDVAQKEAKQSIEMREAAREAIRKGKTVQEFIKGTEISSKEDLNLNMNAYKSVSKEGENDPAIRSLRKANSNNQKLAILKDVKTRMAEDEFNSFLNDLYRKKIISAKVGVEAKK